MQGLREVTLSFASEPEFSAGLLRPLRGLKRLQSVALENRGAVQPTVLGLGALSGISQLRMKGCLVSTACGLNQLTQLTEVALQHCILMLVSRSQQAYLHACKQCMVGSVLISKSDCAIIDSSSSLQF